jgi:hypothetical protein
MSDRAFISMMESASPIVTQFAQLEEYRLGVGVVGKIREDLSQLADHGWAA